jgi:GntR family transcriptional regulator, glc operon transcriptional activator
VSTNQVAIGEDKPFQRRPLTEQVVRYFSDLISEREWPPGTTLPPEPDLARQLGVSRTVIREGIRVLASRGMLVVRQGRGTSVADPSAWEVGEPMARAVQAEPSEMRNWLEVRQALEVATARYAAQRATSADHARIQQRVEALWSTEADEGAYAEADLAFHLAIAEAAHNPQMERLLRSLLPPLRELREQIVRQDLEVVAKEDANREHVAIATAILGGDEDGAVAAMAVHHDSVAAEVRAVEAASTGTAAARVRQ